MSVIKMDNVKHAKKAITQIIQIHKNLFAKNAILIKKLKIVNNNKKYTYLFNLKNIIGVECLFNINV